jgi:LuxR family transcriptional regulator, regulator of acetate metabolism
MAAAERALEPTPGVDGPAVPEVFLGPLGEQLRRRLESTAEEARRELALDVERRPAVPGAELRQLIEAAARQLGDAGEAAVAAHEAALERLRKRFESRFDGLSRVQGVVGELRAITSPAEMLARAPAALCSASAFSRALLSVVRDGLMVAEHAHFAGDQAAARVAVEQLRLAPTRLEHALIETELLRRRRATIVLDAQLHPRASRELSQVMGWSSYAAAPLLVGGSVIGVIHADRGREAHLDVLDRDVLWEFASGLGQAYESAGLRRTLRHERDQMRQFLEWLGARSSELTDAPVTLAGVHGAPLPPPQPLEGPAPLEGHDDRVVFEGLLTRRELDVLRLLADGRSNRQIADALVISGGTVKFHVNSLLRKLRVANRAEAVSRYLRLLGMRMP